MSVYRAGKIRLSEDVRPELADVCLPGPDETVLGQYARMRPQLAAFHAFDKAHILMLAEEGLIPSDDARAMLAVLRDVEEEGEIEQRVATAEHMHSGEAILTQRLGREIAGKMHLGRSSGDLLAVSFRFALREKLLQVTQLLNTLRRATLSLAACHIDTVMPGCTHLQHAQPESFAHYLLAWASAFDRDAERIAQFYARLNLSPAGAAILNGSEFALNRERVADLLGFDGLALNTRDAVWGRDIEIEAQSIMAILAGNFNRFAEDLMLWSAPEFGFVETADGFCGTSSIMPQKKNPNALECLKGVVATASGFLMATLMVHKNPSNVPVFDWVRTMSDAWRNYDEMIGALRLMSAVVADLTVHAQRMADASTRHWATATDLASALVRHAGIPWRAAHQITGITVRLAIEEGCEPLALTTALVDRAAVEHMGAPLGISQAIISDAMDPLRSIERQQLPGGPARIRVEEALVLHEKQLEQDLGWLAASNARAAAGAAKLEEAIDAMLAG